MAQMLNIQFHVFERQEVGERHNDVTVAGKRGKCLHLAFVGTLGIWACIARQPEPKGSLGVSIGHGVDGLNGTSIGRLLDRHKRAIYAAGV